MTKYLEENNIVNVIILFMRCNNLYEVGIPNTV